VSDQTNEEWLASLKPGDQVIVSTNSAFTPDSIGIVSRVTKTLLVLSSGERFRKSDGFAPGDVSYHCTQLLYPTPKRITDVKKRALYRRFDKLGWEAFAKISLQRLQAMVEELEATNSIRNPLITPRPGDVLMEPNTHIVHVVSYVGDDYVYTNLASPSDTIGGKDCREIWPRKEWFDIFGDNEVLHIAEGGGGDE